MINQIVEQSLEELKKAQKDAYPLYYRNIFNNLAKENGLELNPKLILEDNVNEKLLESTKETTEFISKQNKEIENDSKHLIEDIENKNEKDTLTIVKEFEKKLVEKLDKYQSKIDELNKELGKAQKDLYIDPLTKAFNRKALEKKLKEIEEKGKDRSLNIIIMGFDLDHFKNINDTYGHLVGDFVLIKFVQIVKKIILDKGKIYRFGGDEFFIIFNKINKKQAEVISKRILQKILSTKLKYKDNIIPLSCSIGVSCHKKGDTKDTLMERTDKALYESKKERGKVTIKC